MKLILLRVITKQQTKIKDKHSHWTVPGFLQGQMTTGKLHNWNSMRTIHGQRSIKIKGMCVVIVFQCRVSRQKTKQWIIPKQQPQQKSKRAWLSAYCCFRGEKKPPPTVAPFLINYFSEVPLNSSSSGPTINGLKCESG